LVLSNWVHSALRPLIGLLCQKRKLKFQFIPHNLNKQLVTTTRGNQTEYMFVLVIFKCSFSACSRKFQRKCTGEHNCQVWNLIYYLGPILKALRFPIWSNVPILGLDTSNFWTKRNYYVGKRKTFFPLSVATTQTIQTGSRAKQFLSQVRLLKFKHQQLSLPATL
jgi:hypothetical protein